MTRLIGIAGSLRSGSYNAALLRAAASLVPAGTTLEIASIRDIPLYDGDVEAQGIPPAVAQLKDRIAASDGLLLVTPEYNNSIPGVFKNAIDWMSRGDGLAIFVGKPVAVIGASPGGFGTILAQSHWLPVLRTLKAALWTEGRLMVSRAESLFDDQGNLTDDKMRAQLRKFLEGFAATL